jgi:hypothetical protein
MIRDSFKDEESLEAIEIEVGNIIRELITGESVVEKVFPEVKITGSWVEDTIRIELQ